VEAGTVNKKKTNFEQISKPEKADFLLILSVVSVDLWDFGFRKWLF
jgi:hypothetical protein